MVRGIDFLPQEMLLDLPPELIQLVLERCTTTAFLQAAFSCRILYGIASSCREAVLHHLRQTPGPKRDLGRYGTKDLFRKLVSRSIRELYGAQFHANCKAFTFKGHGIDVRASSISKTGQVLSLVARGRPAIYLFRVHKSQFALIKLIKPILGTHAKVEVLRTAFAGDGGFYSLQRVTPVIDGDYGPRWKRGKIYFVHHVLASLSPSHAGSVRICGFPLHEDYEPKAFAVANRNTFAISWQHAAVEDHEVMLYTSLTEFATYSSGVVGLSIVVHLSSLC